MKNRQCRTGTFSIAGDGAQGFNSYVLSLFFIFLLLSSPRISAPVTPGCAFVSASEVRKALAHWVAPGEAGGNTCTFTGMNAEVTVSVQRLTAPLDFESEIASVRAALPESRIRNLPGVAARAVFLDIPGAGTQLHAVRGERDYVMVSILGFGEPAEVSDAAETIARTALSRIARD